MIRWKWKNPMLNRYQQQCVAVYGDADFAHVTSIAEARESGDTLFTFLMIELSDQEGCTTLPEAIRRLEQAQCDIQSVLDAIDDEID